MKKILFLFSLFIFLPLIIEAGNWACHSWSCEIKYSTCPNCSQCVGYCCSCGGSLGEDEDFCSDTDKSETHTLRLCHKGCIYEFYVDQPCPSGYSQCASCNYGTTCTNCDSKDGYKCEGTNRCGTSEGDDLYYYDYYCSDGKCQYTKQYVQGCSCSASDTDGGKNYEVKGTCKDYKGCSSGNCRSSSYSDSCVNSTVVREYYVSGSGDAATCNYTDYDCTNLGSGYGCSDGKCVSFNQPPSATNPYETNYCAWDSTSQVAPGLAIILNWNYSDPDGDSQSAYEIWLDNDSSFSDPKFNHLVENNSATSYVLDLNQDDNRDWFLKLSWNTTYYWKVRVKDNQGNWSDWSVVDSFTTPVHAYPLVNFSWTPQKPSLFEVVQFTDLSQTFGGTTISSWNWYFEGGNPSTSNVQNPTTTFTFIKAGGNEVKLKVCDNTSSAQGGPFCCETSKKVYVTYPLPKWREISSTSWPRKNLIALLLELKPLMKKLF